MAPEKTDRFQGMISAAKALSAGLAASQLLAFLHLFFANRAFYDNLYPAVAAGYLTVPNAEALPVLKTFAAAFGGGVFFTLTVGCLMSLAAYAAAWIWICVFDRDRRPAFVMIFGWGVLIWMVNRKGLLPAASAYLVVVPAVVFAVAAHLIQKTTAKNSAFAAGIFLLPMVVLAAAGAATLDGRVFIDFRDRILLAHPAGAAVNAFYYRYTLYPAEVIKPLEKKLIKTCRLDHMDRRLSGRAANVLLRYDYLPVNPPRPDLILAASGTDFVLYHGRTAVLKAGQAAFFRNPHQYLKSFSEKTDALGFFRLLILVSLLAGLPVAAYILLFAVFQGTFSLVLRGASTALCAAVICIVLGLCVIYRVQPAPETTLTGPALSEMMKSQDPCQRTAAIKAIFREKADIMVYPITDLHVHSSYVPERYWLAMALSVSTNPASEAYLLKLMADPSPNVRYKACYGLGRKGRSNIPVLIDTLERSRHVYVQMYAYNALKDLGWKQKMHH